MALRAALDSPPAPGPLSGLVLLALVAGGVLRGGLTARNPRPHTLPLIVLGSGDDRVP